MHQGLAIRGHPEDEGNLHQLLKVQAEDSETIAPWLKEEQYMSQDIINELVNLMGKEVLKTLLDSVLSQTSPWFSVMADKATDVSNNEQMNTSVRWVDNDYTISEEAIALVELPDMFSDTLVTVHIEKCSH